MASTPEYTRKAVDNYRKKFDVMQLRLPKGTKEVIDSKAGKANAHSFVVECVLKALETPQEAPTEPITEQAEEVPQEQPKELETAHRELTLEELQELINQKKAEQDRKAEEQKKRKEEQEQQEKKERKVEILEHLERIRNGEQIPEDEEKEKLRQESLLKANMDHK